MNNELFYTHTKTPSQGKEWMLKVLDSKNVATDKWSRTMSNIGFGPILITKRHKHASASCSKSSAGQSHSRSNGTLTGNKNDVDVLSELISYFHSITLNFCMTTLSANLLHLLSCPASPDSSLHEFVELPLPDNHRTWPTLHHDQVSIYF